MRAKNVKLLVKKLNNILTNMPTIESESPRRIALIQDILSVNISDQVITNKLATELLRGAEDGLEITGDFEDWLQNRFVHQLVWMNADDYVRALVRALWLGRTFAGTDYGTSRQRDMAQTWTDTARGFVGEIAVAKFLKEKYNTDTRTDTTRGDISQYLLSDIPEVLDQSINEFRPTNLQVSIKTTKFNGRWLDVPGAQFNHSDVFILAKIGITRQHFLGFLNETGFIENLIIKSRDLNELSEEDAEILKNELPVSHLLPVYIAGYIDKATIHLPIHSLYARVYGRTIKKIQVTQGVGMMTPDSIRNHPSIASIAGSENLTIEIDPIIKGYTSQKFLAHSGGMKFGNDWQALIDRL